MKIALATDHAGYELLKDLQKFLQEQGYQCENFGPSKFDPADDYPTFVKPAAEAVAEGKCQRGIIMGGSGQGEAMAANRIHGVRCAIFYGTAVARRSVDAQGHVSHDPYEIVRLSRLHNDANLLSLAARFLSLEEMQQAVKLWLLTPFTGEVRHQRRIKELDEV